ncbi:MAG: protein kinase domain-containing protein [Planctomycetota bacterium]|jgi:serine/threonine-protein kinase
MRARKGLALALAALRNHLVEREALEPFLDGASEEEIVDTMLAEGLITEEESRALRIIEEGRSTRGVPEVTFRDSISDENATMEVAREDSGEGAKIVIPCSSSSERYTILDELGRGGIGAVYSAFDHNLQRHVAIKVMLSERKGLTRAERFIREAKLSGQLQHPNIVPVYDMGEYGNNLPFFTMRMVRGRSLAEVLQSIRDGDRETQAAYSIWRLLPIFQAICMGIAYAHEKGIVHRDLKPENVMIGDFGEVLVMDWGLAKFRDQEEILDSGEAISILEPDITSEGTILGTPIYMSPEQAAGKVEEIDERSDIYALGAILYEILTLHAPFEGGKIRTLLDRVIGESPIPPSVRAGTSRPIHPELDRITLKALRKSKSERYSSVRALHDDVQKYVEGAKERIRRREEAREAIEEGRKLAERYFAMREVVHRYEKTRDVATRKFKGWEPVAEKKELWAIEDQVEHMLVLKGRRFADAVNKFVSALEFESDNKEAREYLAKLYWGRFLEAEEKGDMSGLNYFLATAKFFNDGVLDEDLAGDGTLSVETEPPGGRLMLSKLRERDRILKPEPGEVLGESPLRERTLVMGSYLLQVEAPGMAATRTPILVNRRENVRVEMNLFPDAEIGPGFVYTPRGPFIFGGDEQALAAKPRVLLHLPDYFIARFPVTCRDYLEFLNSLPLDQAKTCVPIEPGTGHPLWEMDEGGKYFIPRTSRRPLFEWHPDMPVMGVSWNMARAYCAWRSDRDGRPYSLPTEEQWEKAARGADGRAYPWGNRFDPTYCKNSRSRPGPPAPEPVGSYPVDASPYGVRDMAGGVREWCMTASDSRIGVHTIRGGSWVHFRTASRCASRFGDAAFATSYVYGFRLATEVPAKSPDGSTAD